MSTHDESLHPRAADGRFAVKAVDEAAGGLDVFSAQPDAEVAATTDLLADPGADHEDLVAAVAPGAPLRSRLTVATSSTVSGIGVIASRDPDPVVRAASTQAWDLPVADRRRLDQDQEVGRVLDLMGAA
ncbi:hypothetical protein [Isoptericola croceus]|uniref:hypothetical protein n=1 Tax=Isoptericola croceus TaxID=3031406 RepID=UPI0023F7C5EF|nr:hypothetical protein [Isoptericola croceus]